MITDQPLEIIRFGYFAVFLVATSLTSQSAGFLCGATMPLKVCFPDSGVSSTIYLHDDRKLTVEIVWTSNFNITTIVLKPFLFRVKLVTVYIV